MLNLVVNTPLSLSQFRASGERSAPQSFLWETEEKNNLKLWLIGSLSLHRFPLLEQSMNQWLLFAFKELDSCEFSGFCLGFFFYLWFDLTEAVFIWRVGCTLEKDVHKINPQFGATISSTEESFQLRLLKSAYSRSFHMLESLVYTFFHSSGFNWMAHGTFVVSPIVTVWMPHVPVCCDPHDFIFLVSERGAERELKGGKCKLIQFFQWKNMGPPLKFISPISAMALFLHVSGGSF